MTLESRQPEDKPRVADDAAGNGVADDAAENVAPPSWGKQVAQLVVIPALIVAVVVLVMGLFALLARQQDSVQDLVDRLRQSSGGGRMGLGFQDPRYKDRSLAAANLAAMLPTVKDPAARDRLGADLVDILQNHVGQDEDVLQVYLLIAIGQVGRAGTLELLTQRMTSERETIRQGAVRGVLSWPDDQQAAAAIPDLIKMMADPSDAVRTEAAMALGKLAQPGDSAVIAALRESMTRAGGRSNPATWNAAVALARLGDAGGSAFVATVLLDRSELEKLPGAQPGQTLSRAAQDRVLLSTLAATANMTDEAVWRRVRWIADNDPSPGIRHAAAQVMQNRNVP